MTHNLTFYKHLTIAKKIITKKFENCFSLIKRFRNCFYCSSLSKLLLLLFLLYSFYYRFNVLYVNWGQNITTWLKEKKQHFYLFVFRIEKFPQDAEKSTEKCKVEATLILSYRNLIWKKLCDADTQLLHPYLLWAADWIGKMVL